MSAHTAPNRVETFDMKAADNEQQLLPLDLDSLALVAGGEGLVVLG